METAYGTADVKVCSYKGKNYCYPEYDSVSALCDKQEKADFNTVYQAAAKRRKSSYKVINQQYQMKTLHANEKLLTGDTNRGAAKTDNRGRQTFITRHTVKETGTMEGQNYSVKERLEQLEALMGKYTAGGKDLCVAFSGGVDSSLILKAAVKAATKDGSKVYAVYL